MKQPASVYIFPNGNIMVFDKGGEQLVKYQKLLVAGLGKVLQDALPECEFYWAVYQKWAEPIDRETIGYFVEAMQGGKRESKSRQVKTRTSANSQRQVATHH